MATATATSKDVSYTVLEVPENSIPNRCEYLMENHCQCPTHAAIQLMDDDESYLCMYHFNLLIITNKQFNFKRAGSVEPEE